MTSNTFYTLAVFAIVLLIITKPIGLWLTPIAQGRAPAVVDAIDRRLISVLAPSGREESWQRYAVSLLTEALQKYPEQSFAQKFGLCNR